MVRGHGPYGIPATFLVGGDGRVAWNTVGEMDDDKFRELDQAIVASRSRLAVSTDDLPHDPSRDVPTLRLHGRWDEVITHYRVQIAKAPDDSNLHYNLACAYARKGEGAKALASLETALKKGFRDFDHVREDADFVSIRGADFNALLAKYSGATSPR